MNRRSASSRCGLPGSCRYPTDAVTQGCIGFVADASVVDVYYRGNPKKEDDGRQQDDAALPVSVAIGGLQLKSKRGRETHDLQQVGTKNLLGQKKRKPETDRCAGFLAATKLSRPKKGQEGERIRNGGQ